MHTVYVLYSKKFNKIYIGYTSNLAQRIESHNVIATKGYTLKYRPWEIIYTEVHEDKKQALLREKQLKTAKGREFIWEIVKQKYP